MSYPYFQDKQRVTQINLKKLLKCIVDGLLVCPQRKVLYYA